MSEREENDRSGFRTELAGLINKHSLENGSDTPDFILAAYLDRCLAVLDLAVGARHNWYVVESAEPIPDNPDTPEQEEE